MTTKLVPQIATIAKASSKWLSGKVVVLILDKDLARLACDQFHSALRNHHGGRCSIARSNGGHCRSIDYAQMMNTPHSQL